MLDSDEDALVPRLLCAGLHHAAGHPVLALLQYETILPLAVGQGDFFAAVIAQKRLDELHPTAVLHPRRYEVLRRWFVSLGHDRRLPAAPPPGDLDEAALLSLDPDTFSAVMGECRIEALEPEPRRFPADGRSAHVIVYGRARWSLRLEAGEAILEGVAEPGEVIAIEPGVARKAILEVAPELPTEMVSFGPEALSALRQRPTDPEAGGKVEIVEVHDTPAALSPAPATAPDPPAESAAAVAPHAIEATPPPPVIRPRPDPRFEPSSATFAPVERRRESTVAINVSSRIARLGLEGTRVAPIGGRMIVLEEKRVELAFARRDLRHLRTRLEGGYLALCFNLGADEPALQASGRVRWATPSGEGPDEQELRVELELLPMRAADRARLRIAVESFRDASDDPAPPRAA